jgi:hypothetical protein
MPPSLGSQTLTRHPPGLLSRAARGATRTNLWVGGGGLRARRSRRHREVTRRHAGQLFLVQLVSVASGHLRRRMCRHSMVVRRSPRMPVHRRLRRCRRLRSRGSGDRDSGNSPSCRSHRRSRIPRLRCTRYAGRPRRQIIQRGGGARATRRIDGRAGPGARRSARAGALSPAGCGERKRGDDRNSA